MGVRKATIRILLILVVIACFYETSNGTTAPPAIGFQSCDKNNTYLLPEETAQCTCQIFQQPTPPLTVRWEYSSGNSTSAVWMITKNECDGAWLNFKCLVSDGERLWTHDTFVLHYACGPDRPRIIVTGGNTQSRCGAKLDIEVVCEVFSVYPPTDLAELRLIDTSTVLTADSSSDNSWTFNVESGHTGDFSVGCTVNNSAFPAHLFASSTQVITVNVPPTSVSITIVKDGVTADIPHGSTLELDASSSVEVTCSTVGGYPTSSNISLECGQQSIFTQLTSSASVSFNVTPDLNSTQCKCSVMHISQCGLLEKMSNILVKAIAPAIIEMKGCAKNNTYLYLQETASCQCEVVQQGYIPVTVHWEDSIGPQSNSSVSVSTMAMNEGDGATKIRKCLVSDGEKTWTNDIFIVYSAYGPKQTSITVLGGNTKSRCSAKLDIKVMCLVDKILPPTDLAELRLIDTSTVLTADNSTETSWTFNVASQHTGDFSVGCMVNNSAFPAQLFATSTQVITVNVPPVVSMAVVKDGVTADIPDGSTLELDAGSSVEVTCSTFGGHPTTSSLIVLECGRQSDFTQSTSSVSVSFNATPDLNSTQCKCSVMHISQCGLLEKVSTILVKVDPTIDFQIQNQTIDAVEVIEGNDVLFKCVVKSSMKPSVSLYLDNRLVVTGDVTETEPLLFTMSHSAVSKGQEAGAYKCVADLGTSGLLKKEISLRVLYPPREKPNFPPVIAMDVDNHMISTVLYWIAYPTPTSLRIYRFKTPLARVARDTDSDKFLIDSDTYTWKFTPGDADTNGQIEIEIMNLDREDVKNFEAVVVNGVGEGTILFTVNTTQLIKNAGPSRRFSNQSSDMIIMVTAGIIGVFTLAFLVYSVFCLIRHINERYGKKKSKSPKRSNRVVMANLPFQGRSLFWQPAVVPSNLQAGKSRTRRNYPQL